MKLSDYNVDPADYDRYGVDVEASIREQMVRALAAGSPVKLTFNGEVVEHWEPTVPISLGNNGSQRLMGIRRVDH